MKITFETIKRTQKITGICEKCGKKRNKTIKSEQTINPFNKNPDGSVKTGWEVKNSVENNLRVNCLKAKEHFICATCYNNLSWTEKKERQNQFNHV